MKPFWNAILLAGGWMVRDNWHIIGNYLSTYGKVILIGIGILILARLIWAKFYQKEQEEA